MHNNGYVDSNRSTKKEFYTVVEAAVLWARSDGAKSANDPRIKHYTQLILESLKRGELKAQKKGAEPESTSDDMLSLSAIISFHDLKKWVTDSVPDSRPAFLFKAGK